jgi:antitoxin component YwqK of YwqJK toxin-antitoxin module
MEQIGIVEAVAVSFVMIVVNQRVKKYLFVNVGVLWNLSYKKGVNKMKITMEVLKKKGASRSVVEEFKKAFPDGAEIEDVLQRLKEKKGHRGYLLWLFKAFALTGVAEDWHPNGRLCSRCGYKNGKPHGINEEWYLNGQLRYRYEYKNGVEHGISEGWNKNGQRSYRGGYKNGVEHGICETWHPNGQRSYRGEFKNGKQHGISEAWDENGQQRYRYEYKNGWRIT